MTRLAVLPILVAAACATKVKNVPADMPGSPAEAESMMQDNTPDKAPPDPEATDPEATEASESEIEGPSEPQER
jgi:hypothetical protein